MSRGFQRVCLAGLLAVGVGGGTTVGAAAPLRGAYLCYSKFQVNPGLWPYAANGHRNTAASLLAAGYWSPYAERSVPTQTKIAGGWYLECNLQSNQLLSPAFVSKA